MKNMESFGRGRTFSMRNVRRYRRFVIHYMRWADSQRIRYVPSVRVFPAIYIAAVSLACFLLPVTIGMDKDSGIFEALCYSFFHANIFHLALNLWALFYFRPRLLTCVVALAVAFISGLIPWAQMDMPTIGLSAFLFAGFARRYVSWGKAPWQLLFTQLLMMFLPFYNWRIHIVAFIIGYMFWFGYYYWKRHRQRSHR